MLMEFFEHLPLDVIRSKVMPCLSIKDCVAMSAVCKNWRKAITEVKQGLSPIDQKLYDHIVFEKKDWEKLGVDVGEELPLTLDQKVRLLAKFKGLCPFFNDLEIDQGHRFKGKTNNRLWETFKIILIPKTIDVNNAGKIFGYRNIVGVEDASFRTKKAEESKFIMASMDVVPGSKHPILATKVKLLQSKGYRIPTPLEAVITVGVLNLLSGKGYYFGGEEEYETCIATDRIFIHSDLIVGSSSKGPEVKLYYFTEHYLGAVAVKDLLEFLDP